MTSTDEILFSTHNRLGLVTLNRPKALNALTLGMVKAMKAQLDAWAGDPAIAAVLVMGEGEKGFCAGGDIRMLQESGRDGTPLAAEFFTGEYQNNLTIARYPKPYIALLDGITMGGGVGISAHGPYRVVTDRTLWAMPETGIGLIPDVGGTHVLPRLAGHMGMYLSLTGARLRAADLIYTGLGNCYVANPAVLVSALKETGFGGEPAWAVESVLARCIAPPEKSALADYAADIDRLFAGDSVEEILAALDADGGEFAAMQAQIIRSKSPLSLKLTHRAVRTGRGRPIDQCLSMEYRLTTRLVGSHDFQEGVRALIVDKDNAPKWDPPRLEEVSEAMVESYFAPLDGRELDLG